MTNVKRSVATDGSAAEAPPPASVASLLLSDAAAFGAVDESEQPAASIAVKVSARTCLFIVGPPSAFECPAARPTHIPRWVHSAPLIIVPGNRSQIFREKLVFIVTVWKNVNRIASRSGAPRSACPAASLVTVRQASGSSKARCERG